MRERYRRCVLQLVKSDPPISHGIIRVPSNAPPGVKKGPDAYRFNVDFDRSSDLVCDGSIDCPTHLWPVEVVTR